MLTRLGRLTVVHRRLVLSLTVLFVIAAAVLGSGAFGVLKAAGFEDPGSESVRAAEVLEERFGAGDPDAVLLVEATGGDPDAPAVVAAATALTDEVRSIEQVGRLVSYWELGGPAELRSSGGEGATALVLVDLDGDEEEHDVVVEELRQLAEGVDADVATVGVGGSAAVFADVGETIEGDLVRAETIAVPITLVLLVLVFGGLVAASLPLLVGVVAVLGTFLTLFVLGSVTDVSVYAINLTTALGLGLAIDYSLFVVSRFREELGNGLTVPDAVTRTVATAGRTIVISGLTVAVSLSALLVFPMYFLRSFAYAGIAVVLLAMVASVVTLPALLAVVGTRVDRLRLLPRRRPRREEDGFWYRTAVRVMRRPIPVALGVTAVLLVLGAPFLRVEFGTPDDRVLPESAPSRVAAEQLRSDFVGDASSTFGIVVTDVPGGPDDAVAAADAAASAVSRLDGVARVTTASGVHVDGAVVAAVPPGTAPFVNDTAARLEVVPTVEMASADGETLVAQIRDVTDGLADDPATAGEWAVGGAAASLVDTKSAIAERLPGALTIIIAATVVLLFLLSGSLLVPLKALVLNLLSLTATFGAMVWIFQDGNLSGLLGFTATGTIDTSMPILMFCIAFGLSMDYEVFLLSRIKEEHDRTGDNQRSVALGLERTGRIVTAAALVLSVTFFSFGTSGVSFITMFGVGLGIAVLMDAFVVRGTLVPAFMRLAGEANWWAPAPLRRLHRRIGLREGDDAPVGEPSAPDTAIGPLPDADASIGPCPREPETAAASPSPPSAPSAPSPSAPSPSRR